MRMAMPQVGQPAPDFQLQTDAGETVRLSDLRGRHVVLFFYPEADTPSCTVEACGFREDLSDFQSVGTAVFGISPDGVEKQAAFSRKFELTYPLLADAEHRVAEAYGVWQLKKGPDSEYMGVLRTTFVIDPQGLVSHVYERVQAEGHSRQVLQALRS
jgi:peroxiredoxin Q/BCP